MTPGYSKFPGSSITRNIVTPYKADRHCACNAATALDPALRRGDWTKKKVKQTLAALTAAIEANRRARVGLARAQRENT